MDDFQFLLMAFIVVCIVVVITQQLKSKWDTRKALAAFMAYYEQVAPDIYDNGEGTALIFCSLSSNLNAAAFIMLKKDEWQGLFPERRFVSMDVITADHSWEVAAALIHYRYSASCKRRQDQ